MRMRKYPRTSSSHCNMRSYFRLLVLLVSQCAVGRCSVRKASGAAVPFHLRGSALQVHALHCASIDNRTWDTCGEDRATILYRMCDAEIAQQLCSACAEDAPLSDAGEDEKDCTDVESLVHQGTSVRHEGGPSLPTDPLAEIVGF